MLDGLLGRSGFYSKWFLISLSRSITVSLIRFYFLQFALILMFFEVSRKCRNNVCDIRLSFVDFALILMFFDVFEKCSKSLIKLTRTRIDVVRRKRNATQKFLRKDIADLLANGLETNAYGRAEGLVKELILSSCYDFIDLVCELVLKHLPVLQKLRECPEDCREAVASLMFAAARFSDLPDLRDLRDLFQERYGNSLEYFVNPKLAENITPKPPSIEKKVQLMQEIALEFSIRWDSRGFEERMSNPSPPNQNQNRIPANIGATQQKVGRPVVEEIVHKAVNDDVLTKKQSDTTHQNKGREVEGRHQTEPRREATLEKRDELKRNIFRGPEVIADVYRPPSFKEETIQKREGKHIYPQRREPKATSHSEGNKGSEYNDSQNKVNRQRENKAPETDLSNTSSRHKPDQPKVIRHSEGNRVLEAVQIGTSSHTKGLEYNDSQNTVNKQRENISETDLLNTSSRHKPGQSASFRSVIPPPYVKPSKNLTKHAHSDAFAEDNDTLTFNPKQKPDTPNHPKKGTVSEDEDVPGRFTDIYYKDEFSSKRRSHKKKHSKVNDEVSKEEKKVMRRVPTSRRKHESKRGLQILFDDNEHPKKEKDEEEKMIDKLLLHYSKKPSNEADSTPTTSRSLSLPPQLVLEPEPKKVFTRAASFEPDTPAKHVHPKLPDYEDLAARFAALRSSKD